MQNVGIETLAKKEISLFSSVHIIYSTSIMQFFFSRYRIYTEETNDTVYSGNLGAIAVIGFRSLLFYLSSLGYIRAPGFH